MDAKQEAIDKLYKAASDPHISQRLFAKLIGRIASLMSVE